MGFFSGISSAFKKVTSPLKKVASGLIGGATSLAGGVLGGGSGSPADVEASSNNNVHVSPVTNLTTNIDFKDLAEATKTAAELSSDTQKRIAAADLDLRSKTSAADLNLKSKTSAADLNLKSQIANASLKLAEQSNAEKNQKFDLLLKNGQYAAIGISALAAYWIYKNKIKKGKK